MEIVITQQNGWSRPVNIGKSIVRIGSATFNEIQLESSQVAPLHLQVFHNQGIPSLCRVLNLAVPVTIESGGKSIELLPFASRDIQDGETIEIAEFRLQFKLPVTTGVVRSSRVIEASLRFSDFVLRSHVPTVGILTIKNNGDKDASQFQVNLRGLAPDCFQVDPVPLMYPGAQEEIRIRLFHKTTYPRAGKLMLTFVISAPESYPGEELLLQQEIYIEPVTSQALDLKDDGESSLESKSESLPVSTEENANTLTAVLPATDKESLKPVTAAQQQIPAETNPTAQVPVVETLQAVETVNQNIAQSQQVIEETDRPALKPAVVPEAVKPVKPPAKLKVVHGPSDEFWDE